jgi:peptidoglycan hydrolase CwlO-like protein
MGKRFEKIKSFWDVINEQEQEIKRLEKEVEQLKQQLKEKQNEQT